MNEMTKENNYIRFDEDGFEDWSDGQLDHVITKDEWISLLKDSSVFDETGLHIVWELYRMPGYAGHIGKIAEADGVYQIVYNGKIGKEIGPKILEALNMPSIKHRSDSGNAGWCVLMLGKSTKEGFAWKLRPELVAALRELDNHKILKYGTVISDETTFLNEYFGTDYQSMRLVFVKIAPEYGVHFIKLADYSDGEYHPRAYNDWVNVLENDESAYYQKNENPASMAGWARDKRNLSVLMIYDFESRKYTFKGVYYAVGKHDHFGFSYYRVSRDFSPDAASIEQYLRTGAQIAAGNISAVVSGYTQTKLDSDYALVESISENGVTESETVIPAGPRMIPPRMSQYEGGGYQRDPRVSSAALRAAGYKCELVPEHETFVRRADGNPYTELHHLIPMKAQDDFKNSLDHPANIVSLCSNCHNRIHYGKDAHLLIAALFEDRKERLKEAGIGTDLKTLIRYYGLDS